MKQSVSDAGYSDPHHQNLSHQKNGGEREDVEELRLMHKRHKIGRRGAQHIR